MKKQNSLAVIAAIAASCFAGSVLAADMAGGGDMHGMKMSSSPKKPMKAKHHHATMAKMSCGDYAWQSQDQKDCEAGKIKPPHGR